MVLISRNMDFDESMPQTVPSAGYTPPCDYTNFAENFDLSLLPGGDPDSSSTPFYNETPLYQNNEINKQTNPKIYTTFYSNSQNLSGNGEDLDLGPDFQQLLFSEDKQNLPQSPANNIYLEVPSNQNYPNSPVGALSPYSPQGQLLSPNSNNNLYNYRQSSEANFYPSSPEASLYTPSPGSIYSRSPGDDYLHNQFIKKEQYTPSSPISPQYSPYHQIKEETYLSPCGFSSPTSPANSIYSNHSSPEQINLQQTENTADVLDLLESTILDKQIKRETTVDFSNILQPLPNTDPLRQLLDQDLQKTEAQIVPEAPKDHQLLRQVLRDTSFQKKFNIKPIDFGFLSGGDIKMEEPDNNAESDLMASEQLARQNIEPVLNLAIEQIRKDVDNTCSALGISSDINQWNPTNVLSWVRWTSRQFNLPEPIAEQWDVSGSVLLSLSEEDFARRAPQGGMILHAQLEIWKAACSEDDMGMQWLPETASSNASSGDVSEEEDDETSQPETSKPSSSRTGGSHIHLWQFLKELLASPQTHGSCIRWLDRQKGIFKIEDSVKVARLWGSRKNRPAMNYDKLSRSIRQYYKKGIMKKTERSQRLVYQFCHPYNL